MVDSHLQAEPDAPTGESPRNSPRRLVDRVLLPTIAVVLALDQLTKYIVRTNLRLGESWPSDGLVRITHGTNTGSAFGLFPNQTTSLIVASIIAIGFLIYVYRSNAMPQPLLRFAIGLQLGGAVGNLIDRVRSGEVVDFIRLGWWPIFNVADSSIVVGVTLLVGFLFFQSVGSDRASEPESERSGESQSVSR